MHDSIFAPYLARWRLAPAGSPITMPAARLLPVTRDGAPAMLKVVTREEAKAGAVLLAWWDGIGAARVCEMDGDAMLMERALGDRSLVAMSANGDDDEATEILCDAVAALHAPRGRPFPELARLESWFAPLFRVASTQNGALARAADAARALLADPRDVLPLHGDIHHENVLDFGARGWLAIDPHGIIGERGFDYANIFCNPDLGDATLAIARAPERFRRRLDIVVARSGIERHRLLLWILAWCGLSAAWFMEDGMSADIDLAIARLAIEASGG